MVTTIVRHTKTGKIIKRINYSDIVKQIADIGTLRRKYNHATIEIFYAPPEYDDEIPITTYKSFK